MKAIKTLVAATALLTTLAATAQTVAPTTNARAVRDEAFGEFIYDSLGATPKIQLKAAPKADAKATAASEKAAVAAKAKEKDDVRGEAKAEVAYTH